MKHVLLPLLVVLFACGCFFRRDPPPGASGERIYKLQLCANCHGPDGHGRPQGPDLRGVEEHWDVGSLARFFEDPQAHAARDPRLADLAERFGTEMTSYANLDEGERRKLAAFVLRLR